MQRLLHKATLLLSNTAIQFIVVWHNIKLSYSIGLMWSDFESEWVTLTVVKAHPSELINQSTQFNP